MKAMKLSSSTILEKVIVAQWIRERHSFEATLLPENKFKRHFPVLARTR